MKKFLKFLIIGSLSVMIISVLSFIVLFFTHNEISSYHYLYLAILLVILVGFFVFPVFVISLLVWLFTESKKTRIIASIILILILLSFTPLIQKCTLVGGDVNNCTEIILPYESHYFEYLSEIIKNPESHRSYDETSWISIGGAFIDGIMDEGIGDFLKEIRANL